MRHGCKQLLSHDRNLVGTSMPLVYRDSKSNYSKIRDDQILLGDSIGPKKLWTENESQTCGCQEHYGINCHLEAHQADIFTQHSCHSPRTAILHLESLREYWLPWFAPASTHKMLLQACKVFPISSVYCKVLCVARTFCNCCCFLRFRKACTREC